MIQTKTSEQEWVPKTLKLEGAAEEDLEYWERDVRRDGFAVIKVFFL